MNEKIDYEKLPVHIAIIMDGNGRWAQKRGFPRTQGHVEGVKRVEEIIEASVALGIKVITFFTFSTENWRRPQNEVSLIMEMLSSVLEKKIDKLMASNVRFQVIGRRDKVSEGLWRALDGAMKKTKDNTGLVVNLAFNYGGRSEIVDAVKNIAGKVKQGTLSVDSINEGIISASLYTAGLPDPDLLIRTSGEQRISNFLLWQLSYAEFYFTPVFWPEFNKGQFFKAICEYQRRERRYGDAGAKVS